MNRAVTTLVLVLLAAGIARAQVPVKERQFVYGINAFAWEGYAGSLSARPAHTIYVLAGHRSIVSARETLVYFWPITGEYRADWSGLNASVAGALEVFQAGRAVTVLPRQSYVIQYPNGRALCRRGSRAPLPRVPRGEGPVPGRHRAVPGSAAPVS